jgi:transcriptional regulator with XRE-family HTH domain
MPTPKSRVYLPHLRAWRLHALLTQDELAEASGVGKATVVRAEGSNPVNALTAARIAKALGITLKQLETAEPEGGK